MSVSREDGARAARSQGRLRGRTVEATHAKGCAGEEEQKNPGTGARARQLDVVHNGHAHVVCAAADAQAVDIRAVRQLADDGEASQPW